MAKAGFINTPPSAEEAAKLQLRKAAELHLQAAYEIAVSMMGGEKRVSRFLRTLQKKQRGRPKGSTAPGRDQALLELHDRLLVNPDRLEGRSVPQWMGEYLHRTCPDLYGATANAI